ncbi:hypothetical protein ALT1000_150007 [Alteromonas macleodii]
MCLTSGSCATAFFDMISPLVDIETKSMMENIFAAILALYIEYPHTPLALSGRIGKDLALNWRNRPYILITITMLLLA